MVLDGVAVVAAMAAIVAAGGAGGSGDRLATDGGGGASVSAKRQYQYCRYHVKNTCSCYVADDGGASE